jgi:hypothetical protein
MCFDVLLSIFRLIAEKIRGKALFDEYQAIAFGVRDLSTLSILRFLPSLELISLWTANYQEKIAVLLATLSGICCKQSQTQFGRGCNICRSLLGIPVGVVNLFGPIISLFAILIKIKQLKFAFDLAPTEWTLLEALLFCGFLNQIAGLRVLMYVEQDAILHFAFSGADALMDSEEVALMKTWWKITICSAVSNLKLSWFDNIVFWFSLWPRTIELLLKNHSAGGSILKTVRDDDTILADYDEEVMRRITCNTDKNHDTENVPSSNISLDSGWHSDRTECISIT